MTFLLSVFCGALSYAQQDQKPKVTPEERAQKRIEMMKKSLNLSDDQVAKLQDLQKQQSEQMKQARAKGDATAKPTAEEMKAKRDAYNAQLKTILTPEQYQKYLDQSKNMHKKAKKGSKTGAQKACTKKPAATTTTK